MPKSYCANMPSHTYTSYTFRNNLQSTPYKSRNNLWFCYDFTSNKVPHSCFLSQSRPSWSCWEQWRVNKRTFSVKLTPDIIGWRWLLDDRKGWRGLCCGGGGLWPWRSMCALALTRIVPVLAGKRLGAIWYDIRDSPFISSSDLRPTVFHPSLYL